MLIALIVIGSIAYYFYDKFMNKEYELKPMVGTTASISDADIKSILFVLKPDDAERLPAVMLFHFDPVRKQEYCVGVPCNMEVDHEGRTMTVRECLDNNGINNLRNALAKTLDQEIDYHVQLDSAGFQKMMGLIGNVTYLVTIHDDGLRPDDTSQQLDSTQFETLLTSTHFYSEEERSTVIGFSVAALLNQCDGKRIAANIDDYFNSIINNITTNVTAMDFSQHRHAVTYVFENATAPGRGMSVLCDQKDENTLTVSPSFIETLKTTFSQQASEGVGTDFTGTGTDLTGTGTDLTSGTGSDETGTQASAGTTLAPLPTATGSAAASESGT